MDHQEHATSVLDREVIWKSFRELNIFFLVAGFYVGDAKRWRILDWAARIYSAILLATWAAFLGVTVYILCANPACSEYPLMNETYVLACSYCILIILIWYRINKDTYTLCAMLEAAYFGRNDDSPLNLQFILRILKIVLCATILSCIGLSGYQIVSFCKMAYTQEFGLLSSAGKVQYALSSFVQFHSIFPPVLQHCSHSLCCYLLYKVFQKCNQEMTMIFSNQQQINPNRIMVLRLHFEQCLTVLGYVDKKYSIYVGLTVLYYMIGFGIVLYQITSTTSGEYLPLVLYGAAHLALTASIPVLATKNVSIFVFAQCFFSYNSA